MCELSSEKLYRAILSLCDERECEQLFSDLFTKKEIQELSSRLEVAHLLSQGTNYNEIARLTGASTATISRVSKCLSGESGGYRLVLSRLYGDGEATASLLVSSAQGCAEAYAELAARCRRLPELPRAVGCSVCRDGVQVTLADERDAVALFSSGQYDLLLGSAVECAEEGIACIPLAELSGYECLLLVGKESASQTLRVATPYPRLVRESFASRGISASVTRVREEALGLSGFDAAARAVLCDTPPKNALLTVPRALVAREGLPAERLASLRELLSNS